MIWVKIDTTPSNWSLLRLPGALSSAAGTIRAVKCGGVSVSITAEAASDSEGDGSFARPLHIRFPEQLLERLSLPTTPVYRARVENDTLLLGPVVGLLLGKQTYRYTPEHMRKYSDRLGIYPQLGGLVCAFSPEAVRWEYGTACGLYYNIKTGEWEYGCFPLPDVVYRRDYHVNQAVVDRLSDRLGGRLFNARRFTKSEFYDYFSDDEALRAFIPPTERLQNRAQAMDFIARYPRSILKPVDLSRGRGIAVVEKEPDGEGYLVTDYRTRSPARLPLRDADALAGFFDHNPGFFSRYIVQQCLPLARIGGMRYDVRVVMQKRPDKSWGCSGIECRVSAPECHLTNISRGGFALTLHEALSRSFDSGWEDIPSRIDTLCQQFCARMDATGDHFAEFGIDIAVDTEKNLWLIESNVFPSFKGFRATDYQTYLFIRYTPLLYALSLTPFAEAGEKEGATGTSLEKDKARGEAPKEETPPAPDTTPPPMPPGEETPSEEAAEKQPGPSDGPDAKEEMA